MNNKVTSVNFGLVNRRMLRGGMILSLLLSLFLCSVFVVCVANAKSVGDIKRALPMTAIVLGISFALSAAAYAYLCFVALDDVMGQVCGRTPFDYLRTDVLKIDEICHYGTMDKGHDDWFCICDCSVYHYLGNVRVRSDGAAGEPRYRACDASHRIMLCFSSEGALDEFLGAYEKRRYGYWRINDEGGLTECERPTLAGVSLMRTTEA